MPKFNVDQLIYADVGDKLNYAACVDPDGDDNLKFVGWIRKFCFKYGTRTKCKPEEIPGLVYKSPAKM